MSRPRRDAAAVLRHALDELLALPAPAWGVDVAARRRLLQGLERTLAPPRRQAQVRRAGGLPAALELAQLAELSGRAFARQREQVVLSLQQALAGLEHEQALAPPALQAALQSLGGPRGEALVRDAHEAFRSFHAGAFKASAVMAGAVLEGAVHAALAARGEASAQAFRRLWPQRRIPPAEDQFTVDEALAVLRELGALSSAVTHVARGVKELRNFVHPSLEYRQRVRVTAAHALLALQALAAIAEELARSAP